MEEGEDDSSVEGGKGEVVLEEIGGSGGTEGPRGRGKVRADSGCWFYWSIHNIKP